jgi:hypothetical protein
MGPSSPATSPPHPATVIQRAEKRSVRPTTLAARESREENQRATHPMTRAGEAAKKESKESKDERPNYKPTKDKKGNLIWDGVRQGLGWYGNVKEAMAASESDGCQLMRFGCTGEAESIDHITDFATLQSGLPRYLVCDGTHHFSAVYKEDASDLYNGRNKANKSTSDVDTRNFQWSCKPCNSSKSGKQGLYENAPRWIERCPGEDCQYVPWGKQAN